MNRRTLATLAATAAILAGPAAADTAGIEAARQAWMDAFDAGDGMAAANTVFTEDAMLLAPDKAIITGREAIGKFWQGAFDAGVHGLKLETVAIDEIGDTAIVTGTWTVTVPKDGGGEIEIGGKDIVVFKKSADGAWQMSQDIWNDGK